MNRCCSEDTNAPGKMYARKGRFRAASSRKWCRRWPVRSIPRSLSDGTARHAKRNFSHAKMEFSLLGDPDRNRNLEQGDRVRRTFCSALLHGNSFI